jgi:hypothetical protein
MKKKVERRSVCIAINKEKKQGKKVERKGECDSALENSTEEPKWRATWASRKRDSEGRRRVAASSSPPLQVLALRYPELGRGYGFSTLPLSSPLLSHHRHQPQAAAAAATVRLLSLSPPPVFSVLDFDFFSEIDRCSRVANRYVSPTFV